MSLDYFDQKKIENLNKIIDQLAERQLGNCKFCKKYVKMEDGRKTCEPVRSLIDEFQKENPDCEDYPPEFVEKISKSCKSMLTYIIKQQMISEMPDEYFFDLVNGSTGSILM